jgi:hypothetical protein
MCQRRLFTGEPESQLSLTGLASAVIEMLTREVEMELLERKTFAAEAKSTPLGDDLDRGTQVLEFGTGGEVGDVECELA